MKSQKFLPVSVYSQSTGPPTRTGLLKGRLSWAREHLREPLRRCTVVAIAVFLLFMIQGMVAILVHNKTVLIASGVVGGILVAFFLGFVALTVLRARRSRIVYSANLCNTISTCLLTMVLCMVLYPLRWYPSLNEQTLHENVEDMDVMAPPALAWISINDRFDAAHLLQYPDPKCFVSDIAGGFGDDVVPCTAQSPDEILATHVCNCSEMFTPIENGPLTGHVGGVSFRSFIPDPIVQINSTDATLNLQVYSDHNTSDTAPGWMLPGPMWLLMLYDPRLSILDALSNGQAAVTHIPVLASTRVVMEPELRIGWTSNPYYYYGIRTTSIPSLNDICDVADDYITWCYTTVVIQFADMTRTVRTRRNAASPGDVFAQVGGYFALVQFLCWIASGMAF